MTLARWEPFSDMSRVLDRWMESRFGPGSRFGSEAELQGVPVDIYDKGNEVVVKASLPGVKAEDIEINVLGDALSIKAQTKTEEDVTEENFVRRERHYGYYQRTVSLPPNLKLDEADATFEDGVLTLHVPKHEEARPKQINVRSGSQQGGQIGKKTERAA